MISASPSRCRMPRKKVATRLSATSDNRTRTKAAPALERSVERFSQFLTLIGLTTLLVGGVGVANAVASYLARKRDAIATMKALGLTGSGVFALYCGEILLVALFAAALGAAAGAALPFIIVRAFGAILPLPVVPALHPQVLAVALGYGLLTALAFALWPLGRAHDISVSMLFRDRVAAERHWPRGRYLFATMAIGCLLAALAIFTTYDSRIATYFVVAALAVFVLLRLVAGCNPVGQGCTEIPSLLEMVSQQFRLRRTDGAIIIRLQRGRGRRQPELQLAAEVQLDHGPGREPALALPGQGRPQEPGFEDGDADRGGQLAAAGEHVLDVGQRVGVGASRGGRRHGSVAGQAEVHRSRVHQGHAAQAPASQLGHVRPPALDWDTPRARGHRRVQQRVRVAGQHRRPRGQVRLDGVHPVGGEHRLVVVVVHDRGPGLDPGQGDGGDLSRGPGHVPVAIPGGRPVHRQLHDHRFSHRWLV